MGAPDPREPATFALVVLIGFVVARFLDVALHEVVGHGAFASASGGAFYGVYISPGSGFAFVLLPPGSSPALGAAVALAGILAEVVLGVALLRAYPRVRTFLGRLFLLLLLEVLLVYSLVYLAVGALDPTEGDSAQAAAILEAPHLVPGFLLVGLLWATAFAYQISKELLRLAAPAAPARRQLLYLSLFWFTPFAVGILPSLVLAPTLSASLLLYLALFLAIGGGVFALSAYLASRIAPAPPSSEQRPVGRLVPIAVAFVLVLPAWLVPFGLTEGTAHGLLIGEPPVAAERTWANPVAINVRAVLSEDRNLTLEFRLKGVPDVRSPLERRVVASFETRADLAYWSESALLLASSITNVSTWDVTYAGIEAVGSAWIGGRTVGHPRLVVLAPTRPEDHARLVPVLVDASPKIVTLVLRDPWQFDPNSPCPACFLDEVNVSWPAGAGGDPPARLLSVEERGGYADRTFGYDAASDTGYARFRNRAPDHAPAAYALLWAWR